ncbi:TIGR04500 family putative peptide maturation system protein [Microbispora sp. NPDC049633]|uniref:TIGR04500 family putative peptide maturation system protein n=1 Tax=Microbispora sp. NPDC049633 TaxID=3154355 RepID=UPI003449BAC9
MPIFSDHLLTDVLAFLRRIGDVEPAEARRLLGGLRAEHPGVPMRLVWQRDHPGGSRHYDMLISAPDGTVSVAFAPARAIPWPLRGSHNAGEQVVVRVDGVDVKMEQAMAVLDGLWGDSSLAVRLVNAALVEQELERDPIELSAEELQNAVDAFRRARGLLTVEATREWMTERGLDHATLEELVRQEAAIAGLRRRVTGDAAGLFAAAPGDYDRLCVVRARYARPEDAEAGVARLREAGRSARTDDLLAVAAAEAFEHGADVRLALAFRCDLGPDAAEARAGDVLAGAGGEPVVACVLAVRPAVFDDETRRAVEKRIFDRWLTARRREASVEWMWGTARRTDSVTRALRAFTPAASEVP